MNRAHDRFPSARILSLGIEELGPAMFLTICRMTAHAKCG
jgi:hypothetical protein